MQEKQELNERVSAQSAESIIDFGKSKRLAAMCRSAERHVDKEELQQKPLGNKKEYQLQQARDVIAQSMTKIKASYPQGMQSKLFALRYGPDEKINQMALQKLFTLLKISQKLAKEIGEVKYKSV